MLCTSICLLQSFLVYLLKIVGKQREIGRETMVAADPYKKVYVRRHKDERRKIEMERYK